MDIYEQLRRDEGLRLKPYLDSVGKLTLGIGRNLTDKGITEEEATYLLQNDVNEVYDELYETNLRGKIDDPRYYVLVNMAFNMGTSGLLAFKKMLKFYNDKDWESAANEMLDSKWATQVGDRAERLAKQMRTGEWV